MAKRLKRPVFVHVNTVKGKGFAPAEKNPGAFHALSKFELQTGNPEIITEDSYSAIFGKELTKIAGYDNRICAVTAAMKYGTGLQYFYSDHKERFFDVGIAEQHAITFSAGLAKTGLIPVIAVYSTFLQRAYDQVLHDAAIDNTHIVLGIDRAGIVGEDGETHQGVFDVAFLTTIPNITLFSPSCYEEVELCLNEAIFNIKGIVGIRYPRGNDTSSFDKSNLNAAFTLTGDNSKILLVTYGRIYDNSIKAKNSLKRQNINCDVLKLTKIFPIDNEVINIAEKYQKIIFLEEGIANGGIAEHFSACLMSHEFKGTLRIVAINDFVKQSSVESAIRKLHLDVKSIENFVRQELENG